MKLMIYTRRERLERRRNAFNIAEIKGHLIQLQNLSTALDRPK